MEGCFGRIGSWIGIRSTIIYKACLCCISASLSAGALFSRKLAVRALAFGVVTENGIDFERGGLVRVEIITEEEADHFMTYDHFLCLARGRVLFSMLNIGASWYGFMMRQLSLCCSISRSIRRMVEREILASGSVGDEIRLAGMR